MVWNSKCNCSRAKPSKATVAPPAPWPLWDWCCPTLLPAAPCPSVYVCFYIFYISLVSNRWTRKAEALISHPFKEGLREECRIQLRVICKALGVLGCLQCRWEALVAPFVSLTQALPWSTAPLQLTCSYRASPTSPKTHHLRVWGIQHNQDTWLGRSLVHGWVFSCGKSQL